MRHVVVVTWLIARRRGRWWHVWVVAGRVSHVRLMMHYSCRLYNLVLYAAVVFVFAPNGGQDYTADTEVAKAADDGFNYFIGIATMRAGEEGRIPTAIVIGRRIVVRWLVKVVCVRARAVVIARAAG